MKRHTRQIVMSAPSLGGNEEKYVLEALRSSWISSTGKFITEFEERFASFVGLRHGVATSNGTTALHLALVALGVRKGDEVIVPNLTFAATVNMVIEAGATPVLVDSLPDHWNIDPAGIRKALTPRTKAIMPVHLMGHPCRMDDIMSIAREHKLFVVEDCAEAHGASVGGTMVGAFGEVSCFSYYGNKIITTGEGGMCVTSNDALAASMRMLRDHGMDKNRRYWHEAVGYNYRMTNLNAAVGVAQMERLNDILNKRRQIGDAYRSGFEGVRGIRASFTNEGKAVDWLLPAFVDEAAAGIGRDALMEKIKEAGIDVRPMFHPLDTMPPYRALARAGNLEHSRHFGATGIMLPLHPAMELEDVAYICGSIKDIVG